MPLPSTGMARLFQMGNDDIFLELRGDPILGDIFAEYMDGLNSLGLSAEERAEEPGLGEILCRLLLSAQNPDYPWAWTESSPDTSNWNADTYAAQFVWHARRYFLDRARRFENAWAEHPDPTIAVVQLWELLCHLKWFMNISPQCEAELTAQERVEAGAYGNIFPEDFRFWW